MQIKCPTFSELLGKSPCPFPKTGAAAASRRCARRAAAEEKVALALDVPRGSGQAVGNSFVGLFVRAWRSYVIKSWHSSIDVVCTWFVHVPEVKDDRQPLRSWVSQRSI